MLLANQKRDVSSFEFVNGDLGYVRGFTTHNQVLVELLRTGEIVAVIPVTRQKTQKNRPTHGESFYDSGRHRYVVGEISYMPVRVAYASTVHKSQGLTLDRVQINLANVFIGQPAMAYVAISRARNLAGLRLVGTPELLANRIMIDPKITRWL
jgi:ATP-dependent exoDNAse (exonuclease V) alpha subunit